MEHTEQTEKKQQTADRSNGGEKKSNGRHRRNRHRKPSAQNGAEAQKKPQTPTGTEASPSGGSNAPQKQGGQKNGSGKKHRGGRDRRGGGRNYETRGPIDPYREAEETAAALAELRAMIVLKSADGSVPASETAPSPVTEDAPTSETEETLTVEEEFSKEDPSPLSPAPETETPLAPDEPPVEVVGIRFRSAGKIYYFDPHGLKATKGTSAIVETARGPEFGDVAIANRFVSSKDVVPPLRPILRIATKEDIAQNVENRAKEERAFAICRDKIAEHKLEMKLVEAQYAFDGSKLLFYFTSDGRVDFRDLVKDLASVFRTRIELRQIGIRDEAKMLGGLGACGRPLCCSTFLPDFAQVSIKMAKEQNLSLNSSKISGVCGRLMCCLRYESDVYSEEVRLTPPVNSAVKTEDGYGIVISTNPLAGTVSVRMRDEQDHSVKTYHRNAVTRVEKDCLPPLEAAKGDTPAKENGAATKRNGSSRGNGRPQRNAEGAKKND